MPGIALVRLLRVTLAAIVLWPLTAGAQRTSRTVSLAAGVQPYATVERATPPAERRAGDSTEYRVTLTVRANTTYRVVARRAGLGGRAIALRVGGTATRLAADRVAVHVARGAAGFTTFDIAYAAEDGGAGHDVATALRFDVIPEPVP